MNAQVFSELLTDISDEYIVSAANPHSKPIRWYQISAIAACIVLLVSAAVYPKLRTRTPEITEPPESVAEVITTTTSVSESAEHPETQTTISPIQTTFASNETDMPLLSVASVNTTPTQPQKSIEKAETEPIITTHTHAVTTSPITSDEPTIQSDEPIVSQIIAIPIYRTEVQPLTTSSTPNEISCYFYDPTADIISEFENLLDDLDLSNCTLICAEISGDIQNAAIIRGEIINDICQLYIAYLNENDTLDNVQIKYLLVFPNELNIKSDQLSANIIPVIGEDFFQILLEESSQSITIQY